MQKTFLTFALCCVSISLLSQSLNTTIFTIKGSGVPDTYNLNETLSPAEKLYQSEYIRATYPLASEVGTLTATSTYNCHAYAWYMYDGGSQAVWMGVNTVTAEDIYWNDGTYVSTTNMDKATKVSYAGNHSGVLINSSTVISKWGVGPLLKHPIGYGPSEYNMANRTYYTPSMSISGSLLLCSTGGNVSISNVPSGATIDWNEGGGIIRNGSNGSNPCHFSSTISGTTSYVGATLSNYGGYVKLSPHTFWVGGPRTPTVVASSNVTTWSEGHYYTVPQYAYDVFFYMSPNVPGYVDIARDEWDYSGVNMMYVNGRYIDLNTSELGQNMVIGTQYNECSGEGSSVYFIVEVI